MSTSSRDSHQDIIKLIETMKKIIKADDAEDVIMMSLDRLIPSIEMILNMGQNKVDISDIKTTASTLEGVSNLISEMSISLSDTKTPGSYDKEEWIKFNKAFKECISYLMTFYQTQSQRKI